MIALLIAAYLVAGAVVTVLWLRKNWDEIPAGDMDDIATFAFVFVLGTMAWLVFVLLYGLGLGLKWGMGK